MNIHVKHVKRANVGVLFRFFFILLVFFWQFNHPLFAGPTLLPFSQYFLPCFRWLLAKFRRRNVFPLVVFMHRQLGLF